MPQHLANWLTQAGQKTWDVVDYNSPHKFDVVISSLSIIILGADGRQFPFSISSNPDCGVSVPNLVPGTLFSVDIAVTWRLQFDGLLSYCGPPVRKQGCQRPSCTRSVCCGTWSCSTSLKADLCFLSIDVDAYWSYNRFVWQQVHGVAFHGPRQIQPASYTGRCG